MRTQSFDTHPEAEKVQVDMIRRASIARRVSNVRSLSKTVMYLSRRALSRAHPELSEGEVDVLFVAYHYGDGLADRLRNDLEQRKK